VAKSKKSPEGEKKKKKKNKTLELIECLLVAAALALTIRHFCFQIFKIPTRSMEPTLYGHADYGDRVVAMMWYKRGGFLPLGLGGLERWQVIVFDHKDERGRPTNFIKRLVGLPGESVEIRDGDIWINGEIARKPRRLQKSLWIKLCDLDFSGDWQLPYYWRAVPGEAAKVDGGRLLVQASPEKKVELIWNPERGIDNRYIRPTVMYLSCPACGHRFRAFFDTSRPVAFCPRPECREKNGRESVVYGVLDNGRAGVLKPGGHFWSEQEPPVQTAAGAASQVADMRLCLDFKRLSGSGELQVVLTGRGQRYRLAVPLGPGPKTPMVRLSGPGGPLASRPVPLDPGEVHHLEVVNIDGEFRAELDGVEIGPQRYAPPSNPLASADATVVVTGTARVALDNLRLYRDIYYGFMGPKMATDQGSKTGRIEVPRKHYFFLGDNSLASQDGRVFGTKGEEKIVARGLLVVWPPSRIHGVR